VTLSDILSRHSPVSIGGSLTKYCLSWIINFAFPLDDRDFMRQVKSMQLSWAARVSELMQVSSCLTNLASLNIPSSSSRQLTSFGFLGSGVT